MSKRMAPTSLKPIAAPTTVPFPRTLFLSYLVGSYPAGSYLMCSYCICSGSRDGMNTTFRDYFRIISARRDSCTVALPPNTGRSLPTSDRPVSDALICSRTRCVGSRLRSARILGKAVWVAQTCTFCRIRPHVRHVVLGANLAPPHTGCVGSRFMRIPFALPTETMLELGTSQSKSGTSLNLSDSGFSGRVCRMHGLHRCNGRGRSAPLPYRSPLLSFPGRLCYLSQQKFDFDSLDFCFGGQRPSKGISKTSVDSQGVHQRSLVE